MKSSRRTVALIAVCIVVPMTAALIGSYTARPAGGTRRDLTAQRVVVVTLPGVTWEDVREADTPVIDKLVLEGATAALAPRTANTHPSIVRGYLTLGAGNRAAASHSSEVAQRALMAEDGSPGAMSTADVELRTIVGRHRKGKIVHLGIVELTDRQRSEYHGTEVGALGEALARAGVTRGVVSAADRYDEEGLRGAAVTTLMDSRGVVPEGAIRELVRPDPQRPFGLMTDGDAFLSAVKGIDARVLLVEPGDTVRADEFAGEARGPIAKIHRRVALERTDTLIGDVADTLGDDDLLLVVASNSHSNEEQEHLTPVIAWGSGVEPGLLLSATTQRPGLVTLTDIAPTVLDVMDVERPKSMSGRPMRVQLSGVSGRPAMHEELDQRSVFRERFVPSVFYTFVALFVLLSLLVGLVYLVHLPLKAPLVAVCYVVLSVPLATYVMSVLPAWKLGSLGAHAVLWVMALVIAGTGLLVAGPRWTGALPLLLSTSVFVATDLATGGHLLVNAVFGNSVLAAGRFYGIPNTGSALFFGATVLALALIGEQLRMTRGRLFMGLGLVVLLVLTGLPPFGADVGGLLTGIAAAAVILVSDRPSQVPWRWVIVGLLLAVAATLLVAYVDSLRPVADQTHFGRFGEALFGGDASAFRTVLRKASQSWSSLSFSRFTYVIPLGIAALAVLLRRPQGPLREVLPSYPLIRSALAGLLVAGVLGFLLNDSGVAVPAMLLAQAVPLVVLLGVDQVSTSPE